MNSEPNLKRCRIVLVAPNAASVNELVAKLGAALSGGDVASVLLPPYEMDETTFQNLAEAAVPADSGIGSGCHYCWQHPDCGPGQS